MAPPIQNDDPNQQPEEVQLPPVQPHNPPHNCFWSSEVKQMLVENRGMLGEIRALHSLLKRQQALQAEKERQLERLSGDISRTAGHALSTVEHVLKAQTALVETTKTTSEALQQVGQLQKSDEAQTTEIKTINDRVTAVATVQDRQKWWIRGGVAVISALGAAIVFLGNTCDMVKKGRDLYMEQQRQQQQQQQQMMTHPGSGAAPTVTPAAVPPHP